MLQIGISDISKNPSIIDKLDDIAQIVNKKKRILYRCDICAAASRGGPTGPSLARPCDRCGRREGQIKLVRLEGRLRTVQYLCEVCAGVAGSGRPGGPG